MIYWPVCKFDLILATLSAFNQCSCLSFASLQSIAIAFRMSAFSASFIAFSFSMFIMLSSTITLSVAQPSAAVFRYSASVADTNGNQKIITD